MKPRVPAPRHFTTPANELDLRAIRAAATQFRRFAGRWGRIGSVRQSRSIHECVIGAADLARNELEVRANDPALSTAADVIDAVICSLGRSGYDSHGRDLAILAYRAGRPCVLAPGIYDQPANMAADAINSGASDMREWLGAAGVDVSPLEFARSSVERGALRAVNMRAAALLARVQGAAVLQAAE